MKTTFSPGQWREREDQQSSHPYRKGKAQAGHNIKTSEPYDENTLLSPNTSSSLYHSLQFQSSLQWKKTLAILEACLGALWHVALIASISKHELAPHPMDFDRKDVA